MPGTTIKVVTIHSLVLKADTGINLDQVMFLLVPDLAGILMEILMFFLEVVTVMES